MFEIFFSRELAEIRIQTNLGGVNTEIISILTDFDWVGCESRFQDVHSEKWEKDSAEN